MANQNYFVFSNSTRVAFFCTALVCATTNLTAQDNQDAKSRMNSDAIGHLANDESFDSDYFLEEFNVVEEQRKKLSKLIRTFSKRFKSAPGQIDERQERRISIGLEFCEKLEDILLQHQVADFHKLVRQRAFLRKMKGFEAWQLWSHPTVQSQLGKNKKEYNKKATEISKKHAEYVLRLKKDSVEKILALCPEEQRSHFKSISRLNSFGIGGLGIPVNLSEVPDWNDKDFDVYENSLKNTYCFLMLKHDEIRHEFELTDSQLDEFSQIWNDPTYRPDDEKTREYYESERQVRASRNDRKLKKMRRDRLISETDRLSKRTDVICDIVLLPHQVNALEDIVKYKRMSLNGSYGDQIGSLIAWMKSSEQYDIAPNALGEMESIHKEFHSKRKDSFDETCKMLLSEMPTVARDHFEDYFGRCYDIVEERRYRNEKLRN